MKSDDELEEMAGLLQLYVIARRRFAAIGDQEGVDLITRIFKAVQAITGPELIQNAVNSVVGCGIALSSKTLEAIKESAKRDLEKYESA